MPSTKSISSVQRRGQTSRVFDADGTCAYCGREVTRIEDRDTGGYSPGCHEPRSYTVRDARGNTWCPAVKGHPARTRQHKFMPSCDGICVHCGVVIHDGGGQITATKGTWCPAAGEYPTRKAWEDAALKTRINKYLPLAMRQKLPPEAFTFTAPPQDHELFSNAELQQTVLALRQVIVSLAA